MQFISLVLFICSKAGLGSIRITCDSNHDSNHISCDSIRDSNHFFKKLLVFVFESHCHSCVRDSNHLVYSRISNHFVFFFVSNVWIFGVEKLNERTNCMLAPVASLKKAST